MSNTLFFLDIIRSKIPRRIVLPSSPSPYHNQTPKNCFMRSVPFMAVNSDAA
jgi:hypothetical protein